MSKHSIYVWKAVLTEVSIAVALWEVTPEKLSPIAILAVVVRAALQGVNASGAYRSDPAGSQTPAKTSPEAGPAVSPAVAEPAMWQVETKTTTPESK